MLGHRFFLWGLFFGSVQAFYFSVASVKKFYFSVASVKKLSGRMYLIVLLYFSSPIRKNHGLVFPVKKCRKSEVSSACAC